MNVREAYIVLETEYGAPPAAITLAFNTLIRVWHPDRFAHAADLKEAASQKTARISAARDLLRRAWATGVLVDDERASQQEPYIDRQVRYRGRDPRLPEVGTWNFSGRPAQLFLNEQVLIVATSDQANGDVVQEYPATSIAKIRTEIATWTKQGRLPVYHPCPNPSEVHLICSDPAGVVRGITVVLRFRNEYYLKLFVMSAIERFGFNPEPCPPDMKPAPTAVTPQPTPEVRKPDPPVIEPTIPVPAAGVDQPRKPVADKLPDKSAAWTEQMVWLTVLSLIGIFVLAFFDEHRKTSMRQMASSAGMQKSVARPDFTDNSQSEENSATPVIRDRDLPDRPVAPTIAETASPQAEHEPSPSAPTSLDQSPTTAAPGPKSYGAKSADDYLRSGRLGIEQGNYELAIGEFSYGIARAPGRASLYTERGRSLQAIGEYERALADYMTALRLDPNSAAVHNNIAWLLATCPQDSLRNGTMAIEYAKKARLLRYRQSPSAPPNSNYYGTLAAAYAEFGLFDLAVEWQTKAVENAINTDKEEKMKRLALYRSRKPFRDEPVKR